MTKNNVTVETIAAAIATLKGAERVTKATLSQLSRDLLPFTLETERIDLVNSTLVVLTPKNREIAELYFKHFLPWSFDGDKRKFGKRFDAGKKTDRKHADMVEHLANPSADIWSWAAREIAPSEFKVPDFKGAIASTIEKAMKGKTNPATGQPEGALSAADVIMAVVSANGIEATEIVDMVDMIIEDNRKNMLALGETPETSAAMAH